MRKELRRILLVSNDPLNTAALANSLRAQDVEIITCEEVEAAEALLSQCNVNVLVTDLFFSERGGLEGLKLIHHTSTHFPETIVVGVCDKLDDEMRQLVQTAGANLVLKKPVSLQDLASVVSESSPAGAHSSLHPQKTGHVHHLGRLDNFLAQNNIDANLQPIVTLDTGKSDLQTLGFESLARGPKNLPLWNPETLFAYAARKERLFETDMFCIQAALDEAQKIPKAGKLFINVRPRSLINPKFVSQVTQMADKAHFNASSIVFELTEQQTILNLQAFSQTLSQLRRLGFSVALDDFGVGFANLQLVQDLKPDYIKVSGIFCRDLETDDAKQVIVEATTKMARQLGIPTILENVETRQELDKARLLGVDYAQGYYFCRPMTSQALMDSGWFDKHPIAP
jgi:EAL domain-containing protein (putative c-di-GMP-specific phosphodiesterase class I)/ActR/RegA family two-component response regulator